MKQVSLAYLVKDPPLDRLAAQIEFMREVADEFVIVVDDRTSQESIGIMRTWPGVVIVPFTWVNDFSAARNAALNHITRPWTLHLDPDEYPSYQMINYIKGVVNDETSATAHLIWTPNFWGGQKGVELQEHWHIRLWRSGHGRWYRPVHELVAVDGEDEAMSRGTSLVVFAPEEAKLIHSKPAEKMAESDALYRSIGG